LIKTAVFAEALLTWFDQHGRKDLPWQQDITPYRVWVSEIMLQQTQVTTVIPYYERFMASFPDIQSLAAASEDKVLHLWTGLGYYARARNLRKAAKIVVNEFRGDLPNSNDALTELPGIGRSTAGAIVSIAGNGRGVILDGNVKRVLARFHAIKGWTGTKMVQDRLWQFADLHTPKKRIAHYTQAIMDLGATVCTRSQPACDTCPLVKTCQAYTLNLTTQLPEPKPKKTLPVKQACLLILENNQHEILLEKRPPTGIWGGLWSLPQHEDKQTLLERFQCYEPLIKKNKEALSKRFRHTFSHYHLDINPVHAKASQTTAEISEPHRWRWFNPQSNDEIGLAAPVKKLLDNVQHLDVTRDERA